VPDKKLYIRSGKIWGISRKILIKALGDYYTEDNPDMVFDLNGYKNEIMFDKVKMNKKLDELKIRHPKSYYSPFEDLPNTEEECVVKGQFGSRGNHLTFTTFNELNKEELHDKYIQHYIPFKTEYRVGVDFVRVLGIREKLPNDDCRCKKIKNSKSCYYETRDIPKLRKFAEKVARLFEVDFTGIDIGSYNNKYIVIELNSSPTIGEYWARLLAEDLIDKLYGG
jgi:glutathione synthase/RimK-type ligase-like ATP-grasp enzyme